MKKRKEGKFWLKKVWRRFLRKCREGRCQAGIPEGFSTKVSWRERR